MRWHTFYDLAQKKEIHLNLNAVVFWRHEWWDRDDDNGPVKVCFVTVTGDEWIFTLSPSAYDQLDRITMALEAPPEHLGAVA